MPGRHLFLVAILAWLGGCGDRQPPPSSREGASASAPQHAGFKIAPDDPEFKKNVQARLDEMQKEESVREPADWFGKTGLSDDDERELPRYLRRELGELLSDPGSLKAAQLQYVGLFVQDGDTLHYWRFTHGSPEPQFAYVVVAPQQRRLMGWGGRRPPAPGG